MRYWIVLKHLASLSLQNLFTSRLDSATFLLGKILRFVLFWIAITGMYRFLPSIAGYSYAELLAFFLTFNLIDVLGQFLFRGVYFLGEEVKRGRFDYILIKPMRPLFFVLFRYIDWLDCFFLIPLTGLTIYVIKILGSQITILSTVYYILGLIVALIITLAIHIFTAGLTVRAGESEQAVWLYREVFQLSRFPIEVFPTKLQFILTYLLPVAISIAWPTQLLLGRLSPGFIVIGTVVAAAFLVAALRFWRSSLYYYSSASS